MKNYKILDANAIKLIAIIAMTIDHIAWAIYPGYALNWKPELMHIIGRITMPTMCFFIAEGFFHTRNVNKYMFRMFLFALISHFASRSGTDSATGGRSCRSTTAGSGKRSGSATCRF